MVGRRTHINVYVYTIHNSISVHACLVSRFRQSSFLFFDYFCFLSFSKGFSHFLINSYLISINVCVWVYVLFLLESGRTKMTKPTQMLISMWLKGAYIFMFIEKKHTNSNTKNSSQSKDKKKNNKKKKKCSGFCWFIYFLVEFRCCCFWRWFICWLINRPEKMKKEQANRE